MLHGDAKSLVERGDRLFSAKGQIDQRNQAIADHFYPERASFTASLTAGDEFASHLMTGYPALTRRKLAEQFSQMLRPKNKKWFNVTTTRPEKIDSDGAVWLHRATTTQRNALEDRIANFERATQEADNDIAAFGMCVISTELNLRDNALNYKCWHPRDVAWCEDVYGQIADRHRNWKVKARDLKNRQGFDLHPSIEDKAKDDTEVLVRHAVVRADDYGWKKSRHPWVSIYVDCDNKHIMREEGSWTPIYTISRWSTVSGSQYGLSPATIIALPDARLIQAMTLSILDMGERAANPPLIGVAEAIRGDLANYPGGFTAVDAEYDERLGEVLRPMTVDKSGIPLGIEMLDRTSQMIHEAFYLNTLSMPPAGANPEMTAFEVGQRVQEYIRSALPVFSPLESDYNGQLCEITFETLFRAGAFGSPYDIPRSIMGSDIDFKFENELAKAIESEKGQKFLEAKAMIAEAMALDPGAGHALDFGKALRDALAGNGTPAEWITSPEDAAAARDADQQKAEAAQVLQAMQQGADVARTVSETAQGLEPGMVL